MAGREGCHGAATGRVLCFPELLSREEKRPTKASPGMCGLVSLTLTRHEDQFKGHYTWLPDPVEKTDKGLD